LFISINPPKFRIPLQTNLLNFLGFLVGARQKMPSFFHREKKRAFEIAISKSNTLYLLYPDCTVGIGISPIQLFPKK
jgi:hypothetical protein